MNNYTDYFILLNYSQAEKDLACREIPSSCCISEDANLAVNNIHHNASNRVNYAFEYDDQIMASIHQKSETSNVCCDGGLESTNGRNIKVSISG